MKERIFSICIIVILTSILAIILPNGKISKIITPIFSLLIMLVFITPIIKLKNEGFNADFSVSSDEILYDENFIEVANGLKITSYEKNCDKFVENLGISNSKTEIFASFDKESKFTVKKVIVNLKNAVISSEKTHIDINEEIKKVLSEYLSVDKSVIEIYE